MNTETTHCVLPAGAVKKRSEKTHACMPAQLGHSPVIFTCCCRAAAYGYGDRGGTIELKKSNQAEMWRELMVGIKSNWVAKQF